LSRNIKRFRERLGFSQLDLSLELEISTTFLSDIETCQKWVSPKTLAKIAKALKTEVYELFKPEDATHEEAGMNPDISGEVLKYLDIVDDTLVKQITHSIQPALEYEVVVAFLQPVKTGQGYDSEAVEQVPDKRKAGFQTFMKYKGILPADFDYRKELADYRDERYGRTH
jgi:transcriptional regulator with XRE-family HTH domain